MIIKAFKVTGLALALDGTETNTFFKVLKLELKVMMSMLNLKMKTHLPLTLTQTLTVTNCICAAVLIRTFPVISYSAKLDSLENN